LMHKTAWVCQDGIDHPFHFSIVKQSNPVQIAVCLECDWNGTAIYPCTPLNVIETLVDSLPRFTIFRTQLN
jgi:hypothetical protein